MTASPPFLGFPDRLADGRMPCAVIFGAGHGSTYPGKDSSGYALAADAIRAASQDDAALVEHWDFDLGGPLFDGKPACCIDAGDIPTTMHDNTGIHPSARQTASSDRCLESRELPMWPRSVACDAFCTGANAIARLVRNSLQPHI